MKLTEDDVGGHLLCIVYRMEGTYIKVLHYFLNLRNIDRKHKKYNFRILRLNE